MGYDSTYFPPSGIKRKDIAHHLKLLGYKKIGSDSYPDENIKVEIFYWLPAEKYKAYEGVRFSILTYNNSNKLEVWGRNRIWCNHIDQKQHNETLRHLRKVFGGDFKTDAGKNRYTHYAGPIREDDELGAFVVTEEALNKLKNLRILLMAIQKEWQTPVLSGDLIFLNEMHPYVIAANMAKVDLLSCIEKFFRDMYSVILAFSPQRFDLIKASLIRQNDLAMVLKGELTLEEAFSHGLGFQNSQDINNNYKKMGFNISKQLNTKIGNRKETYNEFIDRLSQDRNNYVHRSHSLLSYDIDHLSKDIAITEKLILSTYQYVCRLKKWPYERPI